MRWCTEQLERLEAETARDGLAAPSFTVGLGAGAAGLPARGLPPARRVLCGLAALRHGGGDRRRRRSSRSSSTATSDAPVATACSSGSTLLFVAVQSAVGLLTAQRDRLPRHPGRRGRGLGCRVPRLGRSRPPARRSARVCVVPVPSRVPPHETVQAGSSGSSRSSGASTCSRSPGSGSPSPPRQRRQPRPRQRPHGHARDARRSSPGRSGTRRGRSAGLGLDVLRAAVRAEHEVALAVRHVVERHGRERLEEDERRSPSTSSCSTPRLTTATSPGAERSRLAADRHRHVALDDRPSPARSARCECAPTRVPGS